MLSNTLFLAATAALLGSVDAFWRMPCRGTLAPPSRLDPLMDPGKASDHPHVIHGGSNFGRTTTYDDLMASDCTSCGVTQDMSAYWTPALYFMYSNGTTVLVPQIGGMLAYYLLFGEDIRAFPKDFQMIAGDSRLRNFTWPVPDPPKSEWVGDATSQFALQQKALGFNCLNYQKDPPEGTLYRHFMPDKDYLDANCKDGVRFELMFPSCWDGQNNDSHDHRSHVLYPSLVIDGDCPKGFETRVPSLLYETIWDTYAFKGEDGKFVIGNGDVTGFGYHGDFMAAWDVDFLQSAVEICTNPSGRVEDCPLFTLQSESEMQKCQMPKARLTAEDDCTGPREGLCGGVPIQYGPAYASKLEPGLEAQPSPTAPIATVEPLATPQVPVLSYAPGTKKATDAYGGGITVAKLKTNVPAPLATQPAGPIADAPVAVPADVKTNLPVPSAASPAELANEALVAVVTGAAVQTPAGPKGSIVSTSTYTVGHAVYHVAIEQVVVTVTAE